MNSPCLFQLICDFCETILQAVLKFDPTCTSSISTDFILEKVIQTIYTNHTGVTLPVIVSEVHTALKNINQNRLTRHHQLRNSIIDFNRFTNELPTTSGDFFFNHQLSDFYLYNNKLRDLFSQPINSSFPFLLPFQHCPVSNSMYSLINQMSDKLQLTSFGKVFKICSSVYVLPKILIFTVKYSNVNELIDAFNSLTTESSICFHGFVHQIHPQYTSLNVPEPHVKCKLGIKVHSESRLTKACTSFLGSYLNLQLSNDWCFLSNLIGVNQEVILFDLLFSPTTLLSEMKNSSVCVVVEGSQNDCMTNKKKVVLGIISSLNPIDHDPPTFSVTISNTQQQHQKMSFNILHDIPANAELGNAVLVSLSKFNKVYVLDSLINLSKCTGLLYMPYFRERKITSSSFCGQQSFIIMGTVISCINCAVQIFSGGVQFPHQIMLRQCEVEVNCSYYFLVTRLDVTYFCNAVLRDFDSL
ncbi:hypothetical protein RCL1_001983 [Eukaryota sp. TZLM3-RCL]